MMEIILRKRVLLFSYITALVCGGLQILGLNYPDPSPTRFALSHGHITTVPTLASIWSPQNAIFLVAKVLALVWIALVGLCFARSAATGFYALGGLIPVLFMLWWGINQLAGFAGHCC